MAPPSLFHTPVPEPPSPPPPPPPPLPLPTSGGSQPPQPPSALQVDAEEPPAVLQQMLPRGAEGCCVLGGRQTGKSSLAFELCYKLAQREPDRQAVFVHRHADARTVAKAARFVVHPPQYQEHDASQGKAPSPAAATAAPGSWDFSVLESVFLKRFTTAQHLCWYFGSLHQQPDHLLPSVMVVDDLDQFRGEGYGLDAVTVKCQVLSVMHDAAQHIRWRTGRPCWLVVTMEDAERGLMAPLTRQLGRVLRIVRQGSSMFGEGILMLQEDKESAQLLGKTMHGSSSTLSQSKVCRFSLERPEVLEVLGDE